MKILFAAPVTFDRITFFISQYTVGLAKASIALGHDVRIVQTTENMYNPCLWKFLEREFNTLRKYFKPFIDFPHDYLLMHQMSHEIEEFRPNILFLHLVDTYYMPRFIEKIRKKGIKVVVWLGVHPSQVSSGIHRLLRSSDYTLIYDPDYADYYIKQLNINNLKVIPLGCDVDYYASIIPEKKFLEENKTDVCFIGLFDKHRERYLKVLSEFNLGIWSWNIEEYDTPLKKFCKGVVFDKDMIKVIKSSKITLNIHRDFEISGGNYRLFEIPACRVLQVVDDKKDIGKYFTTGKEIITFKSSDDLRAKVDYYLRHHNEREHIASQGYERVKRDHTLVNRMQMILSLFSQ